MATVTAIAKMTSLDTKNLDALIRTAWSKDIVFEALKQSVMANIPTLTGAIDPGKSTKTVPGKIIQDVTPSGMDKFARTVVLERISALKGSGYFGSNVDSILGNEEEIGMKYFKAFAADWGHAVRGQKYGFNYRDQKETEIYEKVKPLLAQWYGELDDYFMHYAYTKSISVNLEQQSELAVTSHFNNNICLIGSTTDAFYSAGDGTYADYDEYEEAICAATYANTTEGKLTVSKLMRIADKCADSNISPVEWGSYKLYVMYVHPEDFTYLIDPAVTGSFGANWVAAAALGAGDLDKVIPGAEFVVAQTLVVVRDWRAARFAVTSATAGDFKFLKQGNVDDRKNITGAKIYNVAIVVGQNALVKFHPEPAHYEDQDEMYKKYDNVGLLGASGYMIPCWQTDANATDPDGVVQEGSMLVLTAANIFDTTT